MEFLKKQSAGFYLSLCTAIIGCIGTLLYFGNTKTAYFTNLGVNQTVAVTLILAVVAELVYIVLNELKGRTMISDLCPIVAAVMFVIGTITFVSTRVNGIAAIMTFTNNANTMADLKNTIVAIAFCAVAMLLAIVASFFKVVKEA